MPSEIEWIVFDAGGVLVELDTPGMFQRLAALGPCDPAEIQRFYERKGDVWAAGALNVDEFRDQLAALYGQPPAESDLQAALCSQIVGEKSDTVALLNKVKANYKTALLSNTVDLHWQFMHDSYSFMPLMDVALGSHILCALKPDPEIYSKALKHLDADASACLLIDDMPQNVAGARQAGWQAVQFVDAADCERRLTELQVVL